MSQAMIADITLHTVQELVVQSSERLPVLVCFWSPLNDESNQAVTILEKLANDLTGRFILAKINVDQQTELAEQFGQPAPPSFKLIHKIDVIAEQEGLFTEAEYRKLIEAQLEEDPSEVLRKQAADAFANGEYDTALALLGDASKANANNYHVHLDLVTMYLHTGHLDKASNLFEKLPEEAQQDTVGKELSGVLFFSTVIEHSPSLEDVDKALNENDLDCHALYSLSAYLILNGQAQNALETLFRIFNTDREFMNGVAKKAILKSFDMLEHQAPEMVKAYRKRFQNMVF